jgi:hypothetical protein
VEVGTQHEAPHRSRILGDRLERALRQRWHVGVSEIGVALEDRESGLGLSVGDGGLDLL